jgi:small-conductance mechanosensitive channel
MLQPWIDPALGLVAALLIGWLVHALVFRLLLSWQRANPSVRELLALGKRPTLWLFLFLALLLALPGLPAPAPSVLQPLVGVLTVAAVAWTLIAAVHLAERWVTRRYDISASDNLVARRVHTRMAVFRRILIVIIAVLAISAMLMTVPSVRALGTSLLASAGLIGLVGGLAARPLLTNLIAGIQIALTEPIRLDDVVVVDGEWGRIEEIATTFVVVRIWDLRRLILPIAYFIETPFQNWTYRSADLLGYIHIFADYRLDVEELRGVLSELLPKSPLWDGQVCNLQVVGSSPQSLELRALFSAADSGKRWDLSVWVREQLLSYLQKHHPDALPRTRVEFGPGLAAEGPRPGVADLVS